MQPLERLGKDTCLRLLSDVVGWKYLLIDVGNNVPKDEEVLKNLKMIESETNVILKRGF
jgi:hypothetical protein